MAPLLKRVFLTSFSKFCARYEGAGLFPGTTEEHLFPACLSERLGGVKVQIFH